MAVEYLKNSGAFDTRNRHQITKSVGKRMDIDETPVDILPGKQMAVEFLKSSGTFDMSSKSDGKRMNIDEAFRF